MPLYEFSEYVRARAASLGISISELARLTGISRQGLYGLLDGTSGQAKISTLMALASALRVHPVVLFRHLVHQMNMPKFATTGSKYQCDASGFVRDVTIPDNDIVTTGQTFTKVWEIQNVGHVVWKNRRLICVDQPVGFAAIMEGIALPNPNRLLKPTHHSIDIPETQPGDTVMLSVEFTSPDYPCNVMSYWKMTDESGDICFPETEGLSCLVQVVSI